ncbi:MAG: hypothetical protein H6587_01550 [Flavobacteriales bacterium]|nr:hypothetical protein [Flavobacteriales bacterium]MCB9363230.1 hypothetical protein [Flavobacteriales bacterium]
MKKNRLIAVAIVVVLALLPFQPAYMNLSVEGELLQVFMMTVVILGSIVAILMYNKDTGESQH